MDQTGETFSREKLNRLDQGDHRPAGAGGYLLHVMRIRYRKGERKVSFTFLIDRTGASMYGGSTSSETRAPRRGGASEMRQLEGSFFDSQKLQLSAADRQDRFFQRVEVETPAVPRHHRSGRRHRAGQGEAHGARVLA